MTNTVLFENLQMSCVEDVLGEKGKDQQEGCGTFINRNSSRCYSVNISLYSCFLVIRVHMTWLLNSLPTMFVHGEILGKC